MKKFHIENLEFRKSFADTNCSTIRELQEHELEQVGGGNHVLSIEQVQSGTSFTLLGNQFRVGLGEDGDSIVATINGNVFEVDALSEGIYSFTANGQGLGCFVIR